MADNLSDDQVSDRLFAALDALGEDKADTAVGQTTLDAARRALTMLNLGLLAAANMGEDDNPVIRPPERPDEP